MQWLIASIAAPIITQFLSRWLFGQDKAAKELERVAREGIMSPSERAQLYGSMRGEAQSAANAILRQSAATLGSKGLRGGAENVVSRDVQRSIGSAVARAKRDVELQNAMSRELGLRLWPAYQAPVSQAIGQGQGAIAGALAQMIPGVSSTQQVAPQAATPTTTTSAPGTTFPQWATGQTTAATPSLFEQTYGRPMTPFEEAYTRLYAQSPYIALSLQDLSGVKFY